MYEFDVSPKLFSSPTIDLYKPKIIQFETLEELYRRLVKILNERTPEISGEYGTAKLALSYTPTLGSAYKLLGRSASFPYNDVELYQTEDDRKSTNRKLITKYITESSLESFREVNFIQEEVDLAAKANSYQEILDQFEDEETFDICVLEVDKKGQFAGIKVGSAGLQGSSSPVFHTKDLVAVSVSTILKSREIICVLRDENDLLEEIFNGQKSVLDLPAKALLTHPNITVLYFCEI
jgi:6-phosphogluconolactonase/glucosamine-6-phosphate isomerase/deaminase